MKDFRVFFHYCSADSVSRLCCKTLSPVNSVWNPRWPSAQLAKAHLAPGP